MITTLAGLRAGLQPPQVVCKALYGFAVWGTPAYVAGMPAATTTPTPGLAGAALTSWAGQIPVPAPVGGEGIYLARLDVQTRRCTGVKIVDRLWHNSGLVNNTNAAQTVNSVAWPARDNDASTAGRGICIGLEVVGIPTTGPTWAISYTNSAGVAGRVGTTAPSLNTMAQGEIQPFSLQDGDEGVRSVESATYTGTTATVAIVLVAYRKIVTVGAAANVVGVSDFIAPISRSAVRMGMPRLWDNSVPVLYTLSQGASTNNQVNATVQFARG